MKVLQINPVSGIRSTGRICLEVAKLLEKRGDECMILYGREHAGKEAEQYSLKCGNIVTNVLHYLTYMLTDNEGKGSYFTTGRFIKAIRAFGPDVIHIHNLHGHYINYGRLFRFLAKENIPVLFSFYDCWMFTGGCTHFDYIGCEKWKTLCSHCPNQSKYPLDRYLPDHSKKNYLKKMRAMQSVKKKILSPGSEWMEGLVRQSFLKENEIVTVQSGIDLGRFVHKDSDIAKKHHLTKKIILLVASQWTMQKGLAYVKPLAEKIGDRYHIVLIGELRDKQFTLPDHVLHIEQTHDQEEMIMWYSAASVYVNVTLQETLGLTNIEALACGTPVVTFDSGGCKECVDPSCGIVVSRGDFDGLYEGIISVLENGGFSPEACRKKSENFDKNQCYQKYLALYDRLNAMSEDG